MRNSQIQKQLKHNLADPDMFSFEFATSIYVILCLQIGPTYLEKVGSHCIVEIVGKLQERDVLVLIGMW